ncbi:carboxypeptidase-like regulatory domain-containing protein [Terrihabitans sp. B22-R8]|uniref:carboxypeptidase-like regulatory domain-containing protein n=1 Tax=Terrihabitans sp. B22-R8 TaxID=3425128 RepID=UPI00403D37B4
MADLARWQGSITDLAGTVMPGAQIEVRDEATGNLAALFSDRAGMAPLANPLAADAEGYAFFHATGGAYRITASLGAFSRVYRFVPIGTAAEIDAEDLVQRSGVEFEGPVWLAADPVEAMEAATKRYVDQQQGGGGEEPEVRRTIKFVEGAYTLQPSDVDKVLYFNFLSNSTFAQTIPMNTFQRGDQIDLVYTGHGKAQFSAASGFTLVNADGVTFMATHGAMATLLFLDPNIALLGGRVG